MKTPQKVADSGFGMPLSVRDDHNGFVKLHRRPDGKRIGLKSM